MKRSALLVVVSSLVAIGLIVGLAFRHGDVKRHETFGFTGVSRVVVNDTQGKIRITAGGRDSVHVDRTSTTLFARATDNAYAVDGVLHLDSHCNHTLCAVDYRIEVPSGVRLKIGGKNLDVAVAGSAGIVGFTSTGDSKITVDRNAKHAVTGWSGSGNVTFTGR